MVMKTCTRDFPFVNDYRPAGPGTGYRGILMICELKDRQRRNTRIYLSAANLSPSPHSATMIAAHQMSRHRGSPTVSDILYGQRHSTRVHAGEVWCVYDIIFRINICEVMGYPRRRTENGCLIRLGTLEYGEPAPTPADGFTHLSNLC